MKRNVGENLVNFGDFGGDLAKFVGVLGRIAAWQLSEFGLL